MCISRREGHWACTCKPGLRCTSGCTNSEKAHTCHSRQQIAEKCKKEMKLSGIAKKNIKRCPAIKLAAGVNSCTVAKTCDKLPADAKYPPLQAECLMH